MRRVGKKPERDEVKSIFWIDIRVVVVKMVGKKSGRALLREEGETRFLTRLGHG